MPGRRASAARSIILLIILLAVALVPVHAGAAAAPVTAAPASAPASAPVSAPGAAAGPASAPVSTTVAAAVTAVPPAPAPPAPAAPAPPAAMAVKAGTEGFSLGTADGRFTLRLRGYVQADARLFPVRALPGVSSFYLKTARPIIDVTLFAWLDFRLMADFGEGRVWLPEAYAEIRPWPWLRLRAGKFKEPFGIERLQSDTTITFVERALPTSLVPNRDVGVMLFGEVLEGALQYGAGFFDGTPDGGSVDFDVDDGKDLVGRVFAHPLRPLKIPLVARLGVGLAVSFGMREGVPASPVLGTVRSSGGQLIFAYRSEASLYGPAVADRRHLRWSPQGYWFWGPFGLLFEYVHSEQGVSRYLDGERSAGGRAPERRLHHVAWQLAAYFVLGADAALDGVRPRHPFAPARGDLGALEIAARFHTIDLDDLTFPAFSNPDVSVTRARTLGAGVHWYVNGNLKVAADLEHTWFKGGDGVYLDDLVDLDDDDDEDRAPETVVLLRLQLAF